MNRLKGIIYDIICWLASAGPRRSHGVKKLLIVRVDEIGDYMLWRPFLKEIRKSEKYKEYKFHFCGNNGWKSLFETFDKTSADKSVWMEKLRFKTEMLYRYRFLKNIYRQKFDAVINPTFSRDKRYDDSIVKAAKAPQALGMVANGESVQPYESGYDKNLYTGLFEYPEKPIFEFIRNRLFTEFITGDSVLSTSTKIDQTLLPSFTVPLPEKYFVVFPGSRSKVRIWPTENFVRISDYLFETYGWTAIVCGTKNDEVYTTSFCEQYKHPILDLTGKTSLPEMLTLFSKAQCLLSVDTGSVHLAAAVNCTVFGIFNGSQYKRFAPYPLAIADNFCAVYPDDIEKELQDPELVKQKYEFVVQVPYSSVNPEKVIHAIYKHYLSK
jgi:ADP-heptose:LPS heptosyltransferase